MSALVLTLRPVSTCEFCNWYISTGDETKLDLLEFIQEEWHGVGSFSKLAWDHFLLKH